MKSTKRDYLLFIIEQLQENGHPNPKKVLVQKLAHFLTSLGVTTGLRFRPYTYGPFSKEIMDIMDDLSFWHASDGFRVEKTHYKVPSPFPEDLEPHLPEEEAKNITKLTRDYFDLINNDTNFNNIELYGTTLYCIKALKQEHKDSTPTDNDVIRDYIEWKPETNKDSIKNAYSRIMEYINKRNSAH